MKKAGLIVLLISFYSHNFGQDLKPDISCTGVKINSAFSKAASLQEIMNKYTSTGLPGVSLAVFNEKEGWWAGSAGYSRVESKAAMHYYNLQYFQSVAKSYMAVIILLLNEEGRVSLDAPISKYLPGNYKAMISNEEEITVRMLLNHTSGLPEYNSHPGYTSYVVLNPQKIISIGKALAYIKDEPLLFQPGSRYRYTNTNYLLLAVIADVITGDHAVYMRKKIFEPLGLKNSYYNPRRKNISYSGLVDSYWDVINEGRPANITPMQKANVAPLMGDDGIVGTPVDAVKFIKGLMEGKLLKDSSLKLMKEWVKNDAGKPAYGMGLIYFNLEGIIAYGHGGGGLGAGCLLLYVPEKQTYLFLSVNLGVLIEGPLTKKVDEMKNEILISLLM